MGSYRSLVKYEANILNDSSLSLSVYFSSPSVETRYTANEHVLTLRTS